MAEKRESAQFLSEKGLKILLACRVLNLSRASFYRTPRDWQKADGAVIDALNKQLKKSPQAGFWKCYGNPLHHTLPKGLLGKALSYLAKN